MGFLLIYYFLQVGFEIWTMQNDILFDNIYVGHSIEDAEALRKETFDVKRPIEEAEEEASKPKVEEEEPTVGPSLPEFLLNLVQEKVDLFISIAKEDPVEAVKAVPEVAGSLVALLVTLTLITVGAVKISSPAPTPAPKKGKEAVSEPKEKAAEAVSSAAETTKGEATKRTKGSSTE